MLVAPIDREDLFRLSRLSDDVSLYNLRDFVREWDLYKIEAAGRVGLLDATASVVRLRDSSTAARTIAKDPKTRSEPPFVSKKMVEMRPRRLYDVEGWERLFAAT